jgi:4'-phosphopantetheinyl transferase
MTLPQGFERPNDHPQLAIDAIHVWLVRIDPAPRSLAAMALWLSADERDRAGRFHFESDRQRYTAARATLRQLLGRYLDVAPAELVFRYGPRGKPDLDGPWADCAIQFNVSHRGEFALMAFMREQLRDVPEALTIARNHFTAAETRLLATATAAAARQECFFRLWTRKEAVIKAVGTGLSMPLEEFDVSSATEVGEAWHVVHVPARPETTWAVRDLEPAAGYRGALCVAGAGTDVSFWRAGDD